jgi:cysteinyl-tRNA synthetase
MPLEAAAKNTKFEADFIAAMNDDFNMPVALSVLFELAHEVQRLREKNDVSAPAFAALLKELGGVVGILQSDVESFFKADSSVDASKVESLIQARQQARLEKNWAEADRIRQELSDMSVVIEDGPNGTTWKSI